MQIQYVNIDDRHPPPADHLARVVELMDTVFGPKAGQDAEMLADELNAHRRWLVSLAYAANTLVGFKIAHRERRGRVRSWLGGVHPDYRRRGIARALMHAQHTWCRAEGFTTIRTVTTNSFRGMLILNIATGFEIVGVRATGGEPKIMLELRLDQPGELTGWRVSSTR